tara:strand:- start:27435 stop:28769 length:1335 start_codon:yes stop_codon:yes gene_type:complete
MRLLGRNHRARVLIMTLLTLSPLTTINALAIPSTDKTSPYYTKQNLKEQQGSYLTEATMLVYDEILRYQRDVEFTHGLDEAAIAAFDYDAFAGNVKWLMDELVGVESDWKKDATPGIPGNTAYGYVQFTEASVKTAVNRYRYHIGKFNSRSILGRRDWQPRGYINSTKLLGGTKMRYPDWLNDLEFKLNPSTTLGVTFGGGYDHIKDLNGLTYDQVVALAFVHLHGKNSKDFNFVQLAKGDVAAAKEIYKNNHHMASGGIQVKNILESLSPKQKTSIYFTIKQIYEPMYGKGSNSTIVDDERYFNYLKGYVGSFFYKQYDWWNTDDDLGWGEFILINGGNALYQIFDMIFERETPVEAFNDLVEQGMGTFDAALNKKDIRTELKNKTVKVQLYNDDNSIGPVIWVGFDKNGDVVAYEKQAGNTTTIVDTDIATQARMDKFFQIH